MNEPQPPIDLFNTDDQEEPSFWDKHRLSLLLIITAIITIVLTSISVILYDVSGTAQLDLSRPGYEGVSSQVDHNTTIDEYSAFGNLDREAIEEFLVLYDEQAAKAKAVDAFNGDPLNPELLELAEPSDES